MKKIAWIVVLCTFSSLAFGQKYKLFYPEVGPAFIPIPPKSDLERRDFLMNRPSEDLSESESIELSKLVDKYGETLDDYYQAIPLGCSWYCGGGPKTVNATSALPDYKDIRYQAAMAHDLDLRTAWVEGAKGQGIGEVLTYTFDANSPRITTIYIYNGYIKSDKAWKANSRVKQLLVHANGLPVGLLQLEDTNARQAFKIGTHGRNSAGTDLVLTFEITDVYPGDKYEDTAITELYFDGIDVHCLAAGTAITMADGTTKPVETIEVGDEVLSRSKEGEAIAAKVEEIASPWHKEMATVSFTNGTQLTLTPDHPIQLVKGQWASLAPEHSSHVYEIEQVQQLVIGQEVQLWDAKNGELNSAKVINITFEQKLQPTYTITRLSRGEVFYANGIPVARTLARKQYR